MILYLYEPSVSSQRKATLQSVLDTSITLIYELLHCEFPSKPDSYLTSEVPSYVSKILGMMIDWIREQVQAGLLEVTKVDTTENLADVLTKIITGGEFASKAALLTGQASV